MSGISTASEGKWDPTFFFELTYAVHLMAIYRDTLGVFVEGTITDDSAPYRRNSRPGNWIGGSAKGNYAVHQAAREVVGDSRAIVARNNNPSAEEPTKGLPQTPFTLTRGVS
ncbi:hypothetical protein ACJJTC_007382 [Scirpophaga incertulas]